MKNLIKLLKNNKLGLFFYCCIFVMVIDWVIAFSMLILTIANINVGFNTIKVVDYIWVNPGAEKAGKRGLKEHMELMKSLGINKGCTYMKDGIWQ